MLQSEDIWILDWSFPFIAISKSSLLRFHLKYSYHCYYSFCFQVFLVFLSIVITPLASRSPTISKSLNFSWDSDSSSWFFFLISDKGYYTFLYGHTTYNREVGIKEQRTHMDLGQFKKGSFMTLCILCASVDYRRRVFCAKFLRKPLGMPINLWLSSFTASFCWPSLPLDCYLMPDYSLLLSVVDWFSVSVLCQLPLCLWDLSFLLHFRPHERSRAQALCLGFVQTKRSSDRHPHPPTHSTQWSHSVTLYSSC